MEAVLTGPHKICFEQKYENCKINQLKIVIFTAMKNSCDVTSNVAVHSCNVADVVNE